MAAERNLNDLKIITDSGELGLNDFSTKNSDGSVSVYFRDLESRLINCIKESQLVVGCVAWLTNKSILEALAKVPFGSALVVQKEDFLKPDLETNHNWKKWLRSMYTNLRNPPLRHTWPGLIGELSTSSDPALDPVRCIGNYNKDKEYSFPRMHNKFLVFCAVREVEEQIGSIIAYRIQVRPYLVWTGSFNLSKSASYSFENAMVISDQHIVEAYFHEWEQIEALSEPLDWDADWVAPEWRIGT